MADSEGYIPVYLPDRTVVGKAKIREEVDGTQVTELIFPPGWSLTELVGENLVGLSLVYQRAEAMDIIRDFEEEKEKKTDD